MQGLANDRRGVSASSRFRDAPPTRRSCRKTRRRVAYAPGAVPMRSFEQVTHEGANHFDYDAFVIHAAADEAFVTKYLLPQLALPPERVLVRRAFQLGEYQL